MITIDFLLRPPQYPLAICVHSLYPNTTLVFCLINQRWNYRSRLPADYPRPVYRRIKAQLDLEWQNYLAELMLTEEKV